jgi:magnesium chelatase family protein
VISKYRSKISGPLLDRIDLHVDVPSLKLEEITEPLGGMETSSQIRERVLKARAIQKNRFMGKSILENGQMSVKHVHQFCAVQEEGRSLLKKAIRQLGLSARAYDRILKVSRTIADLGGSDIISSAHVAEAVSYRFLDRHNPTQ